MRPPFTSKTFTGKQVGVLKSFQEIADLPLRVHPSDMVTLKDLFFKKRTCLLQEPKFLFKSLKIKQKLEDIIKKEANSLNLIQIDQETKNWDIIDFLNFLESTQKRLSSEAQTHIQHVYTHLLHLSMNSVSENFPTVTILRHQNSITQPRRLTAEQLDAGFSAFYKSQGLEDLNYIEVLPLAYEELLKRKRGENGGQSGAPEDPSSILFPLRHQLPNHLFLSGDGSSEKFNEILKGMQFADKLEDPVFDPLTVFLNEQTLYQHQERVNQNKRIPMQYKAFRRMIVNQLAYPSGKEGICELVLPLDFGKFMELVQNGLPASRLVFDEWEDSFTRYLDMILRFLFFGFSGLDYFEDN